MSTCHSCQAPIIWVETSKGKKMPINFNEHFVNAQFFDASAGMVSHFSTCPNAAKHREKTSTEKFRDKFPPDKFEEAQVQLERDLRDQGELF